LNRSLQSKSFYLFLITINSHFYKPKRYAMKRLFTLLLLFMGSVGLFAQIDVTIGTGTVNNINTGYPAPYGNYYKSARHQMLIPASEIIAAGGFAGNINALAFSVFTANGAPLTGFEIKLGTTTATALGVWQTPVMTSVYSVASYTDIAGWNTHTFTSPYNWDGISNLIIETCFNDQINPNYTYNALMNQSTTSYISTMWFNTDTDPTVCSYLGTSTASQRPNIKLTFAPASALDAGIQSIDGPISPSTPGQYPVLATLRNFGSTTLTSATINWSVNGVLQTPYAWTGSLLTATATTPLTLGNYTFPAGNAVIKAWSTAPNSGVDGFAANDTAQSTVAFVTPFAGTYTVGGTVADFATLTAALQQYNISPLSGPVTFLLNNTTLGAGETFPIVIEKNATASAANTLTIKPNTGLSVTISGTSASSIFKINGADYVTIDGSNNGTNSKDLSIVNTNTAANTAAIWISSPGATGASFVAIKNCNIMAGSSTVTSTMGIYVAGISISTGGTGASNNNITLHNNAISKCYYGIFARGVATSGLLNALIITDNEIGSNAVTDYVLFNGITVHNAFAPLIQRNEIFNMKTTSSINISAIELGSNVTDAMVDKNKIYGIHSTSSGGWGAYGVNISSATGTSGITIQNNFISDLLTANYSVSSTTYNAFGIRITGGTNHRVYYNSIHLFGNVTSGSSVGMSAPLLVTATSATGLDVRNNVFANTQVFGVANSKSYTVYVPTGFVFGNINHNNYYAAGPHGVFGYLGLDVLSLMDWSLLTLGDANSVSGDPAFYAPNNLHSFSNAMYQMGTPIAGITDDIDGDLRHAATPCIGADEYMLFANDAGILAMTAPMASCAGILDVKVRIKNFGTQSYTGVTVNWSVNGIAQTPYVFSGTIASGADQEVTIGSYNFLGSTIYNFTFSTVNPGGTADLNTSNDTLTVTGFQTALSGTFTIGSAPTNDFPTVAAAVNAMKNLGICGPVVFNVSAAGGPYLGGIDFTGIVGSTATNTITFNGNGAVINETASPFILKFFNNKYISIDNFQLIVSNTANSRFAILVQGGSQYLTFTNNVINLGNVSTSTLSAGIVASGSETSATTAGNNAQYLTITNNQISGGYYGIVLMGTASYLNNFGHAISNNIITNPYYYGIYLANADTSLVSGNNISRATRATLTTFAGIYGTTVRNIKVRNNQIHSTGVGAYTAYGIWFATTNNSLGYESEFVNNAIFNIPTTGTIYAIYGSTTINYLNMYHNTVHLNPSAGTGAVRGVFLAVAPNNSNLINNIFSIEGAATGTKYGIYVTSTSTSFFSNNNVFYVNAGGTTNYMGYWTANRTLLSDWQTASLQDALSLNANPVLASPATLNITPLSSAIDNMGTPVGVLTDLNNATRSMSAPDIGALEFTGIGSDLAIAGGHLAPGQCLSTNDSVYLRFTNVIGSQINFATATTTLYWNVTGPVNSSGSIVVNSGTLDPGIMMTVGGTGVNMSLPGVYTLRGYLGATSFNLFAGNDTINNMGTKTIYDPFYVQPTQVFIGNTTATVPLTAKSTFFPGGAFYFSEVCQFRGATTGPPVGGWPSYMLADDYIEITGVPNSDLGGYTLEQWNTTALAGTFTFPVGTLMSPAGTAIIAVGEMGSSVPSPSNFYYHGNGAYTSSWGSTSAAGRILKDGSGNIVDAVGYYGFNFPATANVPVSEWSNSNAGGSSTAGIRLTGPDNNTGSNWVVSSATDPQNPNAVNAGTTVPTPTSLTGFTWKHNNVVFATNVIDTTVGPWTTSGVYQYIASYVTPCGTLTDTVSVHVLLATVTGDTIICENDTAMISITLPGTGPWTIIASDGTGVDTFTVATSPFTFYVAPTVTTTYSLVKFADANNVFINANMNHQVTVKPAPAVTLGAFSAACASDPAITLTGGLPSGGNYSGPSVAAGVFTPSSAGPGSHLISYTYVDLTTGCAGTASEPFVVGAGPAFTLTSDLDICAGSPATLEATLPGSAMPSVFFSEYIEGTSNNKAIEIFNATPDTIDLANYRIGWATNGQGWSNWHTFPTGATLAPHTTWVMVANQVSATYYDTAMADQVLAFPSVVHHNGDDARSVEVTTDGGVTWTIIDIFGDPSNDPGTGWPVAGINNATVDKTLIRKPHIVAGNLNWAAIAGTDTASSEFIVHPVNTFTNLGNHSFIAPPIVNVTYAWSTGATTSSITVTPSVTTTYTVTVTDQVTNCGAIKSVVVTVVPAPTVALGPDFDVCDDGTKIIDAGAGFASYLWSTGATTQTIIADGATIGLGNTVTYSVTVTNTAGCEGVDAVAVTAIDCSGIEELDINNALTFWPNPNEGNFFVRIKGISGDATLQITNVAGQMINSEQLTLTGELVRAINLGNLAPGIYMIRLQTNSDVVTKQVIIK
jgi:hypothetical protein